MSKQLPIDLFFKSKINSSPSLPKSIMFINDNNKPAKKRNLSLNRKSVTPSKSPKVSVSDKKKSEIIDLCSDDEHWSSPLIESGTSKDENDASDSSQATVIYSPTPTKFQNNSLTPQTPKSLTPLIGLKVKSPHSINKYYSPSKKRIVPKKSPARKELFKSNTQKNAFALPTESSALLNNACEGMDDKTIFLLRIIGKYLDDPSITHLLNNESQVLLEKCMHVVKPGMRLVCRLFWRKDGWYNEKNIKSILIGKKENEQKEVLLDGPSFITVIRSLMENGLIVSNTDNNTPMTFDDYTNVLSANDMKQICKELKFKKMNNKQDAVDALKIYSKRKSIHNQINGCNFDNSSRVLKIMSQKIGLCYRLSDLSQRTFHKLYILMYLGIDYTLIREKSLELTLIYDKIKKETYPIDSDQVIDSPSIIFKNNEEFERYFKALNVYEDFLLETDVNKKCSTVEEVFQAFKNYTAEEMLKYKALPSWLLRFTPLGFYVKIMSSGIQELKKINKYDIVIDILSTLLSQNVFRQHGKADWYAEKSLVLHKIGQHDEAAKVLLEGLNSDLNEEATDVLRARITITAKHADEQLKNQLFKFVENAMTLEKNIRGVHIHKQPMDRSNMRGKLKYETKTADGRIVQDVEEFSLEHYLKSGEFTHGQHWEDRIVNTMFFLLFWDIIYSKPPNCPGIFLSRFQKYPLDMFCNSFYENRKSSINERIKKIESMKIEDIIDVMREIWESRPEGERSGLHRDNMPWSAVEQLSRCLGARALGALCARLATRYRYACSGFPDLTLWNMHTNQIRFVEVKSDTDRPSLKQLQWMHYLQQHGIDTEFCYVGVHTTRSKARAK